MNPFNYILKPWKKAALDSMTKHIMNIVNINLVNKCNDTFIVFVIPL